MPKLKDAPTEDTEFLKNRFAVLFSVKLCGFSKLKSY